MSNLPAVVPMNELEKMALVVVKSKLFGIETQEQAMTLMLLAQAEGVHPAIAMRDYHIVEGKPALKADAMLARFQAGGGKVEWQEYTDSKVSAKFSHPQSPKPVLIEWSLESAAKVQVYNKKRGGWEPLTNKYNWKAYPRQMLKARVISEGVRATNPGVSVGIYTPEEVQDFSERDVTPNPVTPTAGYLAAQPADRQEVLQQTAQEIKSLFANDQVADAYALTETSGFDAEEMIALWSLLPSDIRSAMKRMKDAEKAAEKGTISPAQKKRLEALIKEHKLDREGLKNWCIGQFDKGHFADLTLDEYKLLDDHIATMVPKTTASPQPSPSVAPPSHAAAGGATQYITEAQEGQLIDLLNAAGIELGAFLKHKDIKLPSLGKMPAARFDGAVTYLKNKVAA